MTLNQILEGLNNLASAASPFLPPNARLAVTLAQSALAAVERAQQAGQADISDADLDALFVEYEHAKADDRAAVKQRLAEDAATTPTIDGDAVRPLP